MNSSKRQPIKAGDIIYPFHVPSPYTVTAPKQLYIGMALEDEKDSGYINFLSLHILGRPTFQDILICPRQDLVHALTILKSLLTTNYNPKRLDALFFKRLDIEGISAERGRSLNNYSYPVDPAHFKPLDSLHVFEDLVERSEHLVSRHLSHKLLMSPTELSSMQTFLSRKYILEQSEFKSLFSTLVSFQCKGELPIANLHLPSSL